MFLRYDLLLPAYGCMARYAGYLITLKRLEEACQQLAGVRQQMVQGGCMNLILPAVTWNLAVAARSGIQTAENAKVLEWMTLQRLREMPAPLPSWAEAMFADLMQREAEGLLGTIARL